MGTLMCPLCCNEKFANQLLLRYHLLSVADNLFCPECNQRFDNILQLANHLDGMCRKGKNENVTTAEMLIIKVNEDFGDAPIEVTTEFDEMENQVEINTRDYEISGVKLNVVTEDSGGDQEDLENIVDPDAAVKDGIIEIANGNTRIASRDITQMEGEDSFEIEMVHDTSESQKIDEDGKVETTEEYACSSCGISFSSVMEHIRMYHHGQEVVVEVPESDKEVLEKLVQTSIPADVNLTVMDDETPANKKTDLQEAFSEELCNAVNKSENARSLAWLKENTMVVADGEKLEHITPCPKKELKPVHNYSNDCVGVGLKYISKEVKIGKLWENKINKKHGSKIIGKSLTKGAIDVFQREVKRHSTYKDTRTSIEKLFSGNCLLGSTGGQGTRPGTYLGVNRIPEMKVLKSPDDEGEENSISVYICNTCQSEFGNLSAFERHSCIKSKACSMACGFCNADITDLKAMQLHMKMAHNINSEIQAKPKRMYSMKPLKCELCDMTFATKKACKLHEKTHVPAEPLECPVCHNLCSSNRTLKQHMMVHTVPVPKKKDYSVNNKSEESSAIDLLVCKLCYKSFANNEDLKTHWQEHVNMDEVQEIVEKKNTSSEEPSDSLKASGSDNLQTKRNTIPCEQCHKEIDKSCKEEHMAKHLPLMRYNCPMCNKSFTKHGHLSLHLKVHRGVKEYSCFHCKKIFSNMNLLRNHVQTHMAHRPYQCGFCGRGFFRPHDKVEHERIHTGEKPFVCPVCGMRFRVRYCLTLHYRRHTGVRPYHCKECDKTFRTGTAFKAHTKIHLDERAYKCPFCPKKFNTMIQLSGHKNSHTKPYSCAECNRPFSSLYAVKKHLASHDENTTGKDPLKFQCQICGASYARRFALRDHLKSHDNILSESTEKVCSDDSCSDLS